MSKTKKTAAKTSRGPFSFAHLIGGAPKPAAEEAPEEKDEDALEGTEDDDQPEGSEDEDNPEGNEDEDTPGGEEDDGTPESEEDEDDPEASAAIAGVVSRAEARGAAKERERCASIFNSEHAAGRIHMAAYLAFNTDMAADAAIGALKASPVEKKGGGLTAAMSQQKNPKLGNGGTGKGTQSADSRLVQRAAEMFAPKKTA